MKNPDESRSNEFDLWEALYTTRAMRRVKPDPIPLAAQERILDAAVRAPSGGNTQGWRFLLVDDAGVKVKLGLLYREGVEHLFATSYADRIAAAKNDPEAPAARAFLQMIRSIEHLAINFETTPLFLFGLSRNDGSGRSILPSVWSAQLAARALGIGTALTSILANHSQEQTCEILDVPRNSGWAISACVSFGYPTGRWGVAQRRPAYEVTYRNRWGEPSGLEVGEPLWP